MTLGVKTSTNLSKKGYETKLTMTLTKSQFSPFDMNTHCLVRQKMLSNLVKNLSMTKYFLLIYHAKVFNQ